MSPETTEAAMDNVTLQENGELIGPGQGGVQKPLLMLNHRLLLAEGVTLRSFFRMLERYDILQQLNAFFEDFLQQYRRSPGQDCRWDLCDHLEFAKMVEMIGFPGDPKLEIYLSLHGISGKERVEIKQSPMECLLDMNVRLGKLKHVVFGDTIDTFEFDTVYTLFEFIDGVAWELGFHGAPRECLLRR